MTDTTLESSRRCARAHSGPRVLDFDRGHFWCRGCGHAYSWREALDAASAYPSAGPGVERIDR